MVTDKTVCLLRTEIQTDPQVIEAAENLAALLVDTLLFQEFSRLSRSVRRDPQAADLMRYLNGGCYPVDVLGESPVSPDELKARLESLNVVQAYREAEEGLRALFGAVDAVIGETTGVAFAENVRAGGYG